ncbi:hypothetical protein ABCY62_12380 [Acetivibrio clariflavus]|uniref:hypothetical protein n=1 Tax=Acetivibrio clariflavus TaxID=288965 RepID=UPI002BF96A9D|nr:hypothetical protein [Acetivibrio clariflavus]
MIGIVFIGDLKYCPYLAKYTNILDREKQEYEVLFWNREANSSRYADNYLSFNLKSKLNKSPIRKILDFMRYARWLNRKIKERAYDKIIVLSTLSGIIIFNLLTRKYKNKYIYDIRDYSYEHNKIFYWLEKKLIFNSYFTCISSEAFREFLPKNYNYKTVHNFNPKEISREYSFVKKEYGETLNLVWIGTVRYFEHQRQIIDKLKEDPRFNLIYHGSGPDLEKFKKYCESNNIKGVTFTGEYNNLEKPMLLKNADILNNSYKSNKDEKIKYAVSNKYYDGLIYKIPQLVETGTYKHKRVEAAKIGIGLDPNDKNFADKLYEYYFSIDEKQFNDSCNNNLNDILKEDEIYVQKILEFAYSSFN